MKKTLALISLSLLLVLWSSSALGQSAHELLSECRPIAKANVSGDYVKFPKNYETGHCWGTFAVIQEIIVHVDESLPIYRVCAPESSSRSQLITVFVDYAEKNPQRLHEDFFG